MDGWLILSRKLNEGVTIFLPDGEKIEVSIFEKRTGGETALAFKAPPGIKILRNELVTE